MIDFQGYDQHKQITQRKLNLAGRFRRALLYTTAPYQEVTEVGFRGKVRAQDSARRDHTHSNLLTGHLAIVQSAGS